MHDLGKYFESFVKDTNINLKYLSSLKVSLNNWTILEKEVITRFVFSCLVDADWLDTEEHFDRSKSLIRSKTHLDLELFIDKINKELRRLGEKSNYINSIRQEVKEYALTISASPVGFYSLNLPTGMGKTLTSFLWGLARPSRGVRIEITFYKIIFFKLVSTINMYYYLFRGSYETGRFSY